MAIGTAIAIGSTLLNQTKDNTKIEPVQQSSSVQRRLTGVDDQTLGVMRDLQDAERAIPGLPADVRQEVAPPIFQSMARLVQQIKERQA